MSQPQATMSNPVPTEVRSISSIHVNQEYRLFISLPANYPNSAQTYPVLYLLDGNGIFSLARQLVEIFQIIQQIPQLIIVGIGYPKDTHMDTLTVRGRDLTLQELTADEKGDYPFEETGGGAKFLNFIVSELIPFIDRSYRTDPNHRTLVGWSLGASFSFYTMFQHPNMFRGIIAISPWISDKLSNLASEYSMKHTSLQTRIFVALEAPEDVKWRKILGDNVGLFVESIEQKHYEGLYMQYRVYEGEDHFSVGPIGLTNGLRYIYRNERSG